MLDTRILFTTFCIWVEFQILIQRILQYTYSLLLILQFLPFWTNLPCANVSFPNSSAYIADIYCLFTFWHHKICQKVESAKSSWAALHCICKLLVGIFWSLEHNSQHSILKCHCLHVINFLECNVNIKIGWWSKSYEAGFEYTI